MQLNKYKLDLYSILILSKKTMLVAVLEFFCGLDQSEQITNINND